MNWVPTLADAEEWCRQKDARNSWADICIAAREIMNREWKKTDEYKAIQKAKQAQARQAREKRQAALENEQLARRAEREAWEVKQKQYETHSRRSRIDWSELLDNPVTVQRQIQWERRTTALAMHKAGLTYREIGERMGVSRTRAAQMVWRASRPWKNQVSPAEAFMNAELHKEVMDMIPRKVAATRAIEPFQYPDKYPDKVDCLLLANGG